MGDQETPTAAAFSAGGLRRAVRADLPRLFEIRNAVGENRLAESWDDFVRIGGSFVDRDLTWVWARGPEILGFAAVDPRRGAIEVLYVDPAAEGQGIGRALLARCCDDLRTAGHRMASLTTAPGTRAERFYRAGGWSRQGVTANGDLLLVKPLSTD